MCREKAIVFGDKVLARLNSKIADLIEDTPILRVDLGMLKKDIADGDTEASLVAAQTHPARWDTTGKGYIVRFFVNEITSSLDIGWFSVSPHSAQTKERSMSLRDR